MQKSEELQLTIPESHEPTRSTAVNSTSDTPATATTQSPLPKRRSYTWWLLVSLYAILVLSCQSGGTLLGRFYFNNGGNSKWLAAFAQSAGFPILIPLLLFLKFQTSTKQEPCKSMKKISFSPSFVKLGVIYFFFGVVTAGDNLMYSYGSAFLPVSTFSLIGATQLAFNALFSYFLNSLKFTPFVLNSLVLLTTSASVLGIGGGDSSPSSHIPQGKHIVGFVCTIGASAVFSLMLSLTQVFFEKVRKKDTIAIVLEMVFFSTMVATSVCVAGLFISGEWRELTGEMELFKTGKASYMMTVGWTAVLWQVYSVSSLGLIYEASSLFSNVISTVCLPVIPILAVILFHDKMDGMKVIAMFLAIWGFISYVYEHYLEYSKSKSRIETANGSSASR